MKWERGQGALGYRCAAVKGMRIYLAIRQLLALLSRFIVRAFLSSLPYFPTLFAKVVKLCETLRALVMVS